MHLLNHLIPVNAQQKYSLFNCKEPSPSITAAEGTFTIENDLTLNEYNVCVRNSSILRVVFPKAKFFCYTVLHD